MQVSLQALRAFEAAARLGSFRQAAEELSLTPTAISHHISNLEARLNVSLFQRTARTILLTEAGRLLAQGVSDGFRTIENALSETEASGKTIKVTTTSSLAAMLLIPSLPQFSARHPDIALEISTGESVVNQPYTLPIRFGETAGVTPEDILKPASFNVFASCLTPEPDWNQAPVTIFTTEWKNKHLPAPPLHHWLVENNLEPSLITVQTFDQEMFGIQQAMAGNGLVFCSTTLVSGLLKATILRTFNTRQVVSDLCYYIPNRHLLSNRNTRHFMQWTETLFNE